MLHSSTWPKFKAMKKGDMISALEDNTVLHNPLVEALICVQRGEHQYMYMKAEYTDLFGFVKDARPQFWHEWLHGPVKMFFDLDFENKANTDAEAYVMAFGFLNALFHKIRPNFSPEEFRDFISGFTVLRRMRAPNAKKGKKLSIHLIQNNGTHFASAASLKAYLATYLTVEICREFCVDMSVYKDGNLQTVGGVKWDEWGGVSNPNRDYYLDHFMPSFFPLETRFEDFDLSYFLKCCVQYIPVGSTLIGNAVVPRNIAAITYNGPSAHLVRAAVERARTFDERNCEAKIVGINTVNSDRANVSLSGVYWCPHGVQQYQNISVLVNFEDEACQLVCLCGSAKKIFFLTEHSQMAHDFFNYSLPVIMEKGLDRVDFPITFDELGGRALTTDFYLSQGIENFFFHPPPSGTGPLYSLLIWRWITCRGGLLGLGSDVFDFRLATTYVNLFFNLLQKRSQFVFRSVGSYLYFKAAELKQIEMQKFTYFIEEEYGRPDKDGIRKTKIVEKKFLDYWMKSKNRIFSDCRVGVFEFSACGAFHDSPPAATNFTKCLEEWQSLNPRAPIRLMIVALWEAYLTIITLLEGPEVVNVAKNWIERWFLTVLFKYGEKLFASVWLVSAEQGTGKSTMPELICKALGPTLTLLVKNMHAFLNQKFNSEGNRGFLFFDDVHTGELTKADAGILKAAVTNQMHISALKYGSEAYQVGNIQNFIVAINPNEGTYIPELGTKTERRNFAMEVPNSEKQEAYFRANPYECEACRENDMLNDGHCIHDFNSFANFWCLWKKHVMGDSFDKRGDLFNLFFGMLFERYLEKKDVWTRSLQTTLPVCKAITSQQEVARPPAFEYLDLILKRGYHACPTGGAQDIFKNKVVDWPDNIPLVGERTSWLNCIPVSTLYQAFKLEIDTQMKIKGFLTQLNQALVERLGKGFSERTVDCISYEFRSLPEEKEFMTAQDGKMVPEKRKVWSYKWVPLSKQSKAVKCLILPSPQETAARSVFMLRQPTNLTTSFALDVTLSRGAMNVSRSSSSASLGSFQPEEESLSGSPDPRDPRSRLKRALDEENAQDEDFYEKRCRAGTGTPRNSPMWEPEHISDQQEEEEEIQPTFMVLEADEVEEPSEEPQEDEILLYGSDE